MHVIIELINPVKPLASVVQVGILIADCKDILSDASPS